MSALQYLMMAHLFRLFQVALLEGEGDQWRLGKCVLFSFSLSFFSPFFFCVIVFEGAEMSLTDAANAEHLK